MVFGCVGGLTEIFLTRMPEEEKYLRDIITKDGRNLKNIQSRVNKGKGIVKRIFDILDGLSCEIVYL